MWSATWVSSWGCSASGVEGNNPQADFGIDLSRTEAPLRTGDGARSAAGAGRWGSALAQQPQQPAGRSAPRGGLADLGLSWTARRRFRSAQDQPYRRSPTFLVLVKTYTLAVLWDEVLGTARALIQVFPRFGQGAAVDPQGLFSVANENTPAWNEDASLRRRLFQALELLLLDEVVKREQGGAVRLTTAGERILGQGPASWAPDPSSSKLREWMEVEALVAAIDERRPSADVTVSRLTVTRWRQFGLVDIVFHPRLTVITGANAAGKTTLLSLLAPLFSWNAQLVSRRPANASPEHGQLEVGQLQYSNGVRGALVQGVAPGVSMSQVGLTRAEPVAGIYISSHRSISAYRPLENLPAQFSTSTVLLQQFAAEIQTRYSGGSSQYPPLYRMKQALVSAAMYGYGNKVVQPTPEALEVWEGFQEILVRFLPPSLGFQQLLVDNGEVIIVSASGAFPLEAASGGLSAMLELAWQIFLRGRESPAFTVCIDEPENHLHPELQRMIMPGLLDAFPKATFIVATHSPFVVTSTPDSLVYALARFEDDEFVSSRRIDSVNASGTADDTLQSVLGLNTPLALWAENALTTALSQLPDNPDTADLLALRRRLLDLGLDRQFPAAIAAIGEAGLD